MRPRIPAEPPAGPFLYMRPGGHQALSPASIASKAGQHRAANSAKPSRTPAHDAAAPAYHRDRAAGTAVYGVYSERPPAENTVAIQPGELSRAGAMFSVVPQESQCHDQQFARVIIGARRPASALSFHLCAVTRDGCRRPLPNTNDVGKIWERRDSGPSMSDNLIQ